MRTEKEALEYWPDGKPEALLMWREFPDDLTYWITMDAPYGISAPGTKVSIYSYGPPDEISVVIDHTDLTEQAKEHIGRLCQDSGADYQESIERDHRVMIDKEYLTTKNPNADG